MKMFLEKCTKQWKEKAAGIEMAANFGYWYLTLMYLEFVLHMLVYDGLERSFLFAAGFQAVIAGVITFVICSLPNKVYFGTSLAVTGVLILFYGSQLVYHFIFGTLYSLSMVGQGGQALTSFWRETLLTMWEKLPFLLLLLIPLILRILLQVFVKKVFSTSNMTWRVGILGFSILLQVALLLGLQAGGTDFYTNYYFYHNSGEVNIHQTTERFGLMTAARLELFNGGTKVSAEGYYVMEETEAETTPEETTEAEMIPVETEPAAVEEEPMKEYNVLEIDFDALNGMTDEEALLAINQYCASLSGTKTNAYTGMLHDYNLIVLCAESFSTGAIHPELTPTLYRLANEGIVFTNYYNTFPNTTTDGEYALCMGLYPDTSRGKAVSSLYASRESYLPFVLGNVFQSQAGIQAYGYHNYLGSYYGREESHPNMGYQMKFADEGMTFTSDWPASDLEMMEQSVDDYIGQEQFHAYYMTFSGHYKYSKSVNPMARRNWELVEDLDLSSEARCYLSCNIELEKGLAYLMERLESEGIADKTAIVLAGDHFPYGLTDKEYSELMGYQIREDDFSKYKSTLIFWVGGLEENIVVDEYCCNVDILPTILNLWGFEYDSRLLAGTDVFSNSLHMAVMVDKSFLTDKVWFNSNTGEITYLVDESEIPDGYVENLIRMVQTRFTVSADILNHAYYNFLFEKGDVEVNRKSWKTSSESNNNKNNQEEEKPDTPVADPDVPAENPNPPVEEPNPPAEEPNPPAENPNPPAEEPNPPAEEPNPPAENPNPPAEEPNPPAENPEPPAEEPQPPAEEPAPSAE